MPARKRYKERYEKSYSDMIRYLGSLLRRVRKFTEMLSISKYHIMFLLAVFSIFAFTYIYLPSSRGIQKLSQIGVPKSSDFRVLPEHNEATVQRIAAENKMFRSFITKEVGFLKLLKRIGIVPILIEPRLLIHLLTNEERAVLIKRNIPITEYSKYTNITTYGVFESNSTNLNENMIERMKANGYEYGKTESLDARYFHWDSEKIKNVVITGHHFFVKSQHVYHLVILYNRGSFLWSSAISSLPSIVSHLEVDDISIGRHASGFEMFHILTLHISELLVQTPSDIKRFLFEIPTSQFMECNFTVAREFYAKYWKEGKPNPSFNERAVNAISAAKELVRPFLIPFWICSGTLLGWYRQCDIIPYTSDVDLAAWSTDFSEPLEERAKQKLNKLILKFVYGIPSESYQYAFYYSGLRIDFFFTYKDEYTYYYGGHMPYSHTYFHYIYPKFTLCSADLLGHKVLVPCNSENVIAAEYGNNWKEPVKSWSYQSSAYNIGPKIKWPSDIVSKTFKTY